MDYYKKQISLVSRPGSAITDKKTTTDEIHINEGGLIDDIRIKIIVEHGYLADLLIHLTSPDGTRVLLRKDVGGDNRAHTHQEFEYTLANNSALNSFKGKDSKGIWLLEIYDDADHDEGTLTEWDLNLNITKRNGVHISRGGYITIPKNDRYLFGNGAFTAMAYVCPKKVVNGTTVLQEGTIVSSKSAAGGDGNGGWQLFLEKKDEDLLLCFKTDDGHGYHLLKAPLNNLYDDKDHRLGSTSLVAADVSRSKKLYKAYTHFVAAVRDTHGGMNLYVNGYLLARATPYSNSGETMDLRSFQLKGIHKESIDHPTHFFTLKKNTNTCTVGVSDWNSDAFDGVGGSFQLRTSSASSNTTNLPDTHTTGIKAINSEIKSEQPASNMLSANMVTLSVTTSSGRKKLLAQFAASSAAKENVNGKADVRIGFIEQLETSNVKERHQFEGYISHVSLWNKGLTQNEVIQYMDTLEQEDQNDHCVGFWKLEHNLKDSTSHGNSGTVPSSLASKVKHGYEPQVLPVYMEEQHKENWCWAATALSVLEYYNPLSKFLQLDIVKTQHGFNLDRGGYSDKYLIGNSPYANKAHFRSFSHQTIQQNPYRYRVAFSQPTQFSDNKSSTVLDFNALEKEINNRNPVCVAVRWMHGYGHIMTLTGIRKRVSGDTINDPNQDFELIINDPWSGIIYISTKDFIEQRYPNSQGGWFLAITTYTIDHTVKPDENWISMAAGEDKHYRLKFDNSKKLELETAPVSILRRAASMNVQASYNSQKKTSFGISEFFISKKGELTLHKTDGSKLTITETVTKDGQTVEVPKTVPAANRPASLGVIVAKHGDTETWDIGVKDRDGKLAYSIKQELGWSDSAT